MNELEQAEQAHKLVWSFRRQMEQHWPTPGPLDALRYSFTEAGEAMDAYLRQTRPSDSRNNHRDNDVLDELADCAIMLLTAVQDNFYPVVSWRNDHKLEVIAAVVGRAVLDMEEELAAIQAREDCRWLVSYIAQWPGMDLLERIAGRLEQIAWKHAPHRASHLVETLGLKEKV